MWRMSEREEEPEEHTARTQPTNDEDDHDHDDDLMIVDVLDQGQVSFHPTTSTAENDHIEYLMEEMQQQQQQQQQDDDPNDHHHHSEEEEEGLDSWPPLQPPQQPPPPILPTTRTAATAIPLPPQQPTPQTQQEYLQRRRDAAARFSSIYAWISFLGALLAICTTTTTTTTTTASTSRVALLSSSAPSSTSNATETPTATSSSSSSSSFQNTPPLLLPAETTTSETPSSTTTTGTKMEMARASLSRTAAIQSSRRPNNDDLAFTPPLNYIESSMYNKQHPSSDDSATATTAAVTTRASILTESKTASLVDSNRSPPSSTQTAATTTTAVLSAAFLSGPARRKAAVAAASSSTWSLWSTAMADYHPRKDITSSAAKNGNAILSELQQEENQSPPVPTLEKQQEQQSSSGSVLTTTPSSKEQDSSRTATATTTTAIPSNAEGEESTTNTRGEIVSVGLLFPLWSHRLIRMMVPLETTSLILDRIFVSPFPVDDKQAESLSSELCWDDDNDNRNTMEIPQCPGELEPDTSDTPIVNHHDDGSYYGWLSSWLLSNHYFMASYLPMSLFSRPEDITGQHSTTAAAPTTEINDRKQTKIWKMIQRRRQQQQQQPEEKDYSRSTSRSSLSSFLSDWTVFRGTTTNRSSSPWRRRISDSMYRFLETSVTSTIGGSIFTTKRLEQQQQQPTRRRRRRKRSRILQGISSSNDDDDNQEEEGSPSDLVGNDHESLRTSSLESPPMFSVWIMDPTLLHPSSHTLTDLADKILTSTPRLLAIANFLLALTYIVHAMVADWFLGNGSILRSRRRRRNIRRRRRRQQQRRRNQQRRTRQGGEEMEEDENETVHVDDEGDDDNEEEDQTNDPINGMNNGSNYHHHAVLENGREKMGGFLVFKLLLVSAVVTPDTLDLLILLSWYTLLAFLRSLAHLCASAVRYASAAGQIPAPGVWQLLVVIWMGNLCAAATCVALFYGAGIGMVLLLTCDCALTAVDVLVYLLQHVQATWEIQHAVTIAQLEEQQQQAQAAAAAAAAGDGDDDDMSIIDYHDLIESTNRPDFASAETRAGEQQQQLEEIALQIQQLEEQHNHRVGIVEGTVFALQLLGNVITVCHFLHIWSWHGVQFTLIDGVLALHLHSAISSASKKIAQRRNLNRIARDLDEVFEDATDTELRGASLAGDVCCVCLSSMNSKRVKKVACGHLYHTSCLREVVERARSMEAARCPLCRASVLDGKYHNHNNNNSHHDNNHNNHDAQTPGNNHDNQANRAFHLDGEGDLALDANGAAGLQDQALFRISTEGIIPSWIPIHIPSFSFEVVRRAPLPATPPPETDQHLNREETANDNHSEDGVVHDNEDLNERNEGTEEQGQQTEQGRPANNSASSILRRLLVVAGALPMSPEEEAIALEQLVDMFPQYDRADLQRELRQQNGSTEIVAERILSGSFSGAPR